MSSAVESSLTFHPEDDKAGGEMERVKVAQTEVTVYGLAFVVDEGEDEAGKVGVVFVDEAVGGDVEDGNPGEGPDKEVAAGIQTGVDLMGKARDRRGEVNLELVGGNND